MSQLLSVSADIRWSEAFSPTVEGATTGQTFAISGHEIAVFSNLKANCQAPVEATATKLTSFEAQ